MVAFVMYCLFFMSDIALSQTTTDAGFLSIFGSWPEIGKLIAFVVALQLFLRGLAEALTRFADYTDNTWDNKLANWISEAAWLLGLIVGKLGYGEPKLVTQEKVEQLSQPSEKTAAVDAKKP